jgi:predicted PurR-regulated permease PerM
MSAPQNSPSWGSPTKSIVAVVLMVLAAAILLRFSTIIPLLVTAGILAFLTVPLTRFMALRLKLPWGIATNLTFLILVLFLLGVSTATGLAALQQLQALFITLQRILVTLPSSVTELSQRTFAIGPWLLDLSRFDLGVLADQALGTLQPVLGQASGLVRSLATVALESVARVAFVLAVAYFMTLDFSRIQSTWHSFSIPGYEYDLRRLRRALAQIWDSFLRGQLIIVLVSGVLTSILMAGLGVRFSIGLGVIAGVAKFVPIVGPVAAGALAAVVALFQAVNWLGLSPAAHATLVVITLIVLNQAIDYILLPRIMGNSLNLHPVVILVGAIIGASLAGVIGLLLSAPSVASLVLLARYAFRKMVDLSPWEPAIDAVPEVRASPFDWLMRWRRRPADEPGESS